MEDKEYAPWLSEEAKKMLKEQEAKNTEMTDLFQRFRTAPAPFDPELLRYAPPLPPKTAPEIKADQPNLGSRRQKIVAECIEQAADFGDRTKVTELLSALDAANIPLPRRRNSLPRKGTWSGTTTSLRAQLVKILKRDFYRYKSKNAPSATTK
jgi:hypothetical protein